eukprot:sb/3476466/
MKCGRSFSILETSSEMLSSFDHTNCSFTFDEPPCILLESRVLSPPPNFIPPEPPTTTELPTSDSSDVGEHCYTASIQGLMERIEEHLKKLSFNKEIIDGYDTMFHNQSVLTDELRYS